MPSFCILSGKKEERICQKMTIRTTIRKNDCISQSPVSIKKLMFYAGPMAYQSKYLEMGYAYQQATKNAAIFSKADL